VLDDSSDPLAAFTAVRAIFNEPIQLDFGGRLCPIVVDRDRPIGDLRPDFAAALGGCVPAEELALFDGDAKLSDSEHIGARQLLTVRCRPRETVFRLDGSSHALRISFDLPLSVVRRRVADAVGADAGELVFSEIESETITLEGLGRPPEILLERQRRTVCVVGRERRMLCINPRERLRSALATMLDRPIGRVLAGGAEVADADTLADVGFPAEIVVHPPPTSFVLGGERHSIEVEDDIPFSEILALVLPNFASAAADDIIGVCRNEIEIGSDMTIASVGRPDVVELRRRSPDNAVFIFEEREYRVAVAVARDLPLSSVLEDLEPLINVRPSDLVVEFNGSEVDFSTTLADLEVPPVLRLRRTRSPETVFEFEGHLFPLADSRDAPLSTVLDDLTVQVGVPVSELVVTIGGAVVDMSSTLAGLGGPSRVLVARAAIDLRVNNAVRALPSMHVVQVSPLATLAEAEDAIRAACGVGDDDIEFAAIDESGATQRVDAGRSVRDFVGPGLTLVLRPFGSADEAPAPASLRACPVRAEAAAPPGPDEIKIKFAVSGSSAEPFTETFQKRDTMAVARERVAARLELPSEEVTLLFAGKPFKDEFVLGRLRIGSQAVTVYQKKKAEILLISYHRFREEDS
jgi:hypothetical protein